MRVHESMHIKLCMCARCVRACMCRLCMCLCVHVSVCVHIFISLYVHVCVYVCMCLCLCACVCTCVCILVCVCRCAATWPMGGLVEIVTDSRTIADIQALHGGKLGALMDDSIKNWIMKVGGSACVCCLCVCVWPCVCVCVCGRYTHV